MNNINFNILAIIPNSNQGKKKYNILFNLGIPYAVAAMEQCGCNVDVLDLNLHNGSGKKEIIAQLRVKGYDIVATGGTIFDLPAIKNIFTIAKQFNPEIINLVGGRIILYDSELIFSELNADFGVIGDVDITLQALLHKLHIQSDEIVNNTIYRKNGKIFKAPTKANKSLIDQLPYPAIEKCGYKNLCENQIADNGKRTYYSEKNWKSYSIVPSINCIHSCTFCANNKHHYRARSEESLLKEMDYAVEHYDTDIFIFAGDVFSPYWKDVERFCENIHSLQVKHNKKLHFVLPLRVDDFTVEKARYLKEAGCVCVFFGLESYDDMILKSMRKHITTEDLDNAIQACLDARLIYKGNFIFGDIAETKESYLRTLNYWKEKGRGFADIFPIIILPGSYFMDYCIEKGIIKDKLTYYRQLSTTPNYYLLSKKISPYMSNSEHERMLNLVIAYFIKYQHYSQCQIIGRNKHDKLCSVKYHCGNCSETNIREGVYLKYGIFSWLVCSHCGARQVVHTLPPSFVKLGVNVAYYFISYFGMKIKKTKFWLKSKLL